MRGTRSAERLRDVIRRCPDERTQTQALYALNDLPAPAPLIPLSLKPRQGHAYVERVALEVPVYFSVLESYPPDEALVKLSQLLERVNQGFAVDRVTLRSAMDLSEVALPGVDLARQRGELMRQYFVAAGFDPTALVVEHSVPREGHTIYGRALNRVVDIRVEFMRERASPQRPALVR
jgi:hypothetical protein